MTQGNLKYWLKWEQSCLPVKIQSGPIDHKTFHSEFSNKAQSKLVYHFPLSDFKQSELFWVGVQIHLQEYNLIIGKIAVLCFGRWWANHIISFIVLTLEVYLKKCPLFKFAKAISYLTWFTSWNKLCLSLTINPIILWDRDKTLIGWCL